MCAGLIIWLVKFYLSLSGSEIEKGVGFLKGAQPAFLFGVAIIYYYIGVWLIEAKLSHCLEKLGRLRKVEIAIRGFILVSLSSVAVLRDLLTPIEGMTLFFGLLVVWDCVIYAGGQIKLAKFFLTPDFIGLGFGLFLIVIDSAWLKQQTSRHGALFVIQNIAVLIGIALVAVAARKSFDNIKDPNFPRPDQF